MKIRSIFIALLLVTFACSSGVTGDGSEDEPPVAGDDDFVLDTTKTTLTLSPGCAPTPATVPTPFTYSEGQVYINPDYTGEVSNGSEAQPWKDLSFLEGALKEFAPNTEYLFKRGTELDISWTYMKISSAAPPTNIKLGAYGEGEVRPSLVSRQKGRSDAILQLGPTAENVWIEGLEISYEGTFPWNHTLIDAGGASHATNIVIRDNELHHGGDGIRLWGASADNSHWYILENHIHDINTDGIIMNFAHNIEVGHNIIERVNTGFLQYVQEEPYDPVYCPEGRCPGDAIQLINGNNNWVHHNIIDRHQIGNKFGIILTATSAHAPGTNPTGTIVECNTLAGPAATGGGGVSMFLAGHDDMHVRYNTILPPHTGAMRATVNHMYIYGNIISGGLDGIRVLRMTAGLTDNHIFNNVFYGIHSRGTNAHVFGHGRATNNIFYNAPEVNVVGSNIQGSHNLYLTDNDTFGDNNVVGVDPLFVDAENGDFHLQAESPAINAGTTLTFGDPPEVFWTHDLDQNAVSDPPEIGPYEFQ